MSRDIHSIDRRLDKLENGRQHPPLIVWKGHENSVKPKPGQEIIRIAWGEPETSTLEDDRKKQKMQELPQKQAKAIISLLSSRTIQEAATQAGVNESTIWRWMKEQAFSEALTEAKHRMVAQAIIQLQQTTGEAVGTLRGIMADGEAPASARVTAAKAVLDFAVRAVKLEEIEDRLKVLESKKIRNQGAEPFMVE